MTKNFCTHLFFNPLWATTEQRNFIRQRTVIGALGVDGWAVQQGGPGRDAAPPRPSSLYQM